MSSTIAFYLGYYGVIGAWILICLLVRIPDWLRSRRERQAVGYLTGLGAYAAEQERKYGPLCRDCDKRKLNCTCPRRAS